MRLWALVVILAVLVGCGAGEEAQEEQTTEEETELAQTEDPFAECESKLYATKGPNATQRWEAASEPEKQRMCTQLEGSAVPNEAVVRPGEEVVTCQLRVAQADLGDEGLNRLINEWEPQWVGTPGTPEAYISPTLPEFLAERGYECN